MDVQLEKDQEILLTIKSIGINGEGIGFYKRKAVFVDGVMPPEVVVVRIIDVKRTFAYGETIRIKKRAYYRTRPFCKYYGVCGGCQLQHVAYDEQLRLKEDLLKQAFNRYAPKVNDESLFQSFTPLNTLKHYRHKAQMPVMQTKEGVVAGLYKKNTMDLLSIPDCPVQHPTLNRVIQEALAMCNEQSVRAFDAKTMRGLLRHIVARISSATGEVQLTLVVSILSTVLKPLAEKLLDIDDVVSVALSVRHDAKNHEVFGDSIEVVAGKQYIVEKIRDVEVALGPKAFYQINPEAAHAMIAHIETLFDTLDESLCDMFTGSGAMALAFANRFKRVVGVDASQASIDSAKENAKRNQFNHVRFLCDDASRAIKTLFEAKETFDVMMFDPPRTGLGARLIDQVLKNPVKKLVYVSCNPSTLAKDIERLRKLYTVKSITPFDMFPHTSHVESISLLTLKTA